MIEWFCGLFPNTYQGAANCVVCGMCILFAVFVLIPGVVGGILIYISDRREEKKAKKMPSYIRAYDKHGNRIK